MQFALMRMFPMLEEIDALPGSQRQLAFYEGYGKVCLCQCCSNMRGHIVGPLLRMVVM